MLWIMVGAFNKRFLQPCISSDLLSLSIIAGNSIPFESEGVLNSHCPGEVVDSK